MGPKDEVTFLRYIVRDIVTYRDKNHGKIEKLVF